jgi:hypothetical protein
MENLASREAISTRMLSGKRLLTLILRATWKVMHYCVRHGRSPSGSTMSPLVKPPNECRCRGRSANNYGFCSYASYSFRSATCDNAEGGVVVSAEQ